MRGRNAEAQRSAGATATLTVVRRSFVFLLVAVALVAAACGGEESEPSPGEAAPSDAAPADKVCYSTDFLIRGHQSGYWVGEDNGWFDEAGVDLTLLPGQGSTATAQLVANGNCTFGNVATNAMLAANAQGLDLIMVAVMNAKDGSGVIVPAESDIRAPEDLIGKTVSLPGPGSYSAKLFFAWLDKVGIDREQIKTVTVNPEIEMQLFTSGEFDARLGSTQGEIGQLEVLGFPARILPFAEQGIDEMAHGIVTRKKLYDENPDLVKRFVDVALRGWQFTLDNPEEAATILNKYYPQEDLEQLVQRIGGWKTVVKSEANEDQPLGWIAREDFLRTIDLEVQFGELDRDALPPVEEMYTNEFIPDCPSYDPC